MPRGFIAWNAVHQFPMLGILDILLYTSHVASAEGWQRCPKLRCPRGMGKILFDECVLEMTVRLACCEPRSSLFSMRTPQARPDGYIANYGGVYFIP